MSTEPHIPLFRLRFCVSFCLLATLSWILTLVSQILVEIAFGVEYLGVMWFAIVLQSLFNLGVLSAIRRTHTDKLLANVASILVVLGSIGIDKNVYASDSRRRAMAAGWIILTILNAISVVYFATDTSEPINDATRALRPMIPASSSLQSTDASTAPSPTVVDHSVPFPYSNRPLPLINEESTLASSEKISEPPAGIATPSSLQPSLPLVDPTNQVRNSVLSARSATTDTSTETFSIRAEARWGYIRSPDDKEELSFSQGEILSIAYPITGKWWTAKKADGTTGIVPSNYLRLLV